MMLPILSAPSLDNLFAGPRIRSGLGKGVIHHGLTGLLDSGQIILTVNKYDLFVQWFADFKDRKVKR